MKILSGCQTVLGVSNVFKLFANGTTVVGGGLWVNRKYLQGVVFATMVFFLNGLTLSPQNLEMSFGTTFTFSSKRALRKQKIKSLFVNLRPWA